MTRAFASVTTSPAAGCSSYALEGSKQPSASLSSGTGISPSSASSLVTTSVPTPTPGSTGVKETTTSSPVEAFAGTAVPSTGGEMTFVCPGDVDCFAGGVVLWTEAPSVALDVATPDGDLAARATVPLAYETQFCGDDGHCAIQCLLAIETVTLSRP